MTIDAIREAVLQVSCRYPISKATLFGSRASGTQRPDSDVDLIVEFSKPISLLTLSALRCDLMEILGISVDLIHGPLRPDAMIEIARAIELYAA